MAERTLIAEKSFTYLTRRLKPGDSFEASGPMARALIATRAAREGRTVGRVEAPPARVVAKAVASTPTPSPAPARKAAAKPNPDTSGFLDRSVDAVRGDLGRQSLAKLRGYLRDERRGKSRKTLIEALQSEIDAKKA